MADKPERADDAATKNEKARQLAEEALGAYADGDKPRGDKLAEQAQEIDRAAVVEVVEEIDEDAARQGKAGKQTD